MAAIFANDTTNTLDQVAEQIKAQANTANTDVKNAITALSNDNGDNPAVLADLQHKLNK